MRRVKKSQTKISKTGMMIVPIEDNRALQTIGSRNNIWNGHPVQFIQDGALVRMIPPHDATDAKIHETKQSILNAGAKKVKQLPRAPAPIVVHHGDDEVTIEEEAAAAILFKTPRKVIDEKVSTAFTERREELGELVNKYLGVAEARRPVDREHASIDVGYITGIRLENWMCFKGEFVLKLEPKVYSITAEDVEDPDRSNWLGKSSLLRAIVFAVTGKYPTKTADGWIHEAEPSGAVELEFSSGLFISRWKDRGKGTQVEVSLSDDVDPMTGKAAQRFLEEAVINLDTLERTAYIEQKSVDRFITMGPAERSETVNGWLGIGWIEDAGAMCLSKLNSLSSTDASCHAELAHLKEQHGDDIAKQIVVRTKEVKRLLNKVTLARSAKDETKELNGSSVEWNRANRQKIRYEALQIDLDELDETEPQGSVSDINVLESTVEKCATGEADAAREYRTAASVAQGEFDGVCPVAGIECPAATQINKQGKPGRVREKNAKTLLDESRKTLKVARDEHSTCARLEREVERFNMKRKVIVDEMARLKPDYDFIVTAPEKPQSQSSTAEEEYETAVQLHSDAVSSLKVLERGRKSWDAAEQELRDVAPHIELHRSAHLILGRSGAQRAIAEGALRQVERVGNNAIVEAGIGLQFKVKWASETKKLADACESCGAPFPSSQRVKVCSRCGADRGPKLSHELRIAMSNSSGGADDLAGFMFQLSAANWLRQYEGSTWSVFLIDEPFGALDRANVRGLSQHIGNLLGDQFGGSQAFIVAHHADVLESTPGRIHITSSYGKSSVEVRG